MEHGRKIGSRRLIRTFIAIRLPELVLEALGQLSAGVAQDWPPQSVRWARKEGLHLTLRFLGDTEEKQITALQLGLDEAVAGFAPFELWKYLYQIYQITLDQSRIYVLKPTIYDMKRY